jgi:hypothetical protein
VLREQPTKSCSEVREVGDKQASANTDLPTDHRHTLAEAHVLSIRVRETKVILTCQGVAGE